MAQAAKRQQERNATSKLSDPSKDIRSLNGGMKAQAGSPVQAQEQFKALRTNIARMERQLAKAKAEGNGPRIVKLQAMLQDSQIKARMLVDKVARYYNG